jgi:uncharacterized protein (TIGR03118 family)
MKRVVVAFALLLSSHALGHRVRQINLVADQPGVARFTDPNLVNPWGLVIEHDKLRVANNHSGLSTLYFENGAPAHRTITIPPPKGAEGPSAPTGMVDNHSDDFVIHRGRHHAPAELIFVTEDGTISGWSPFVDRDEAILEVDNSASGAIYKGVALARHGHETFLYATNFVQNKVEIYDEHFGFVRSFTDTSLPTGFAPFGIRNIAGYLFVTFALQKAPPDQGDDQAGPGNGFIDIFDADGHMLKRFASNGVLNSPWGLELATVGFERFAPVLLVGNFGDGRINAFDFFSGASLGPLEDQSGHPIVIDGLWSISFEGDPSCDSLRGGELFFTAGPNEESNGLLGVLVPHHH